MGENSMYHTKCIYIMALTVLVLISCKGASVSNDENTLTDSTFGLSIDSNYYSDLSAPGAIHVSERESQIYQMLIAPTANDTGIILINNKVLINKQSALGINPDSIDQVEAFNDYLRKNEKDTLLTDYNLGINVEYLYLNSREMSESYGSYYFWDVFRLKYPKTRELYSTSQIGFNSDSTTAVVTCSYGRDALWGEYTVQVLKLQNSEWMLFKIIYHVVS